ncbi:unnamed protein product, partial [marine sediment metagenome]
FEIHRLSHKEKITEELTKEVSDTFQLERFPDVHAKTDELIDVKSPPSMGTAIFEASEELKQQGLSIKDFAITKSGSVNISISAMKTVENLHSIKAETPNELEVYKGLMEFIGAVEKLDNLLRKTTGMPFLPKPLFLPRLADWFRYDPEKGYTINLPRFIALKRAIQKGPVKQHT